jgi:hypothetical protein
MGGEGRIAKQIGAHGYYACVTVRCQDIGTVPSPVTLDPSADDSWYRSQGWTNAALAGAALGLKFAGIAACCKVMRIHGMPCDTNSTLVAIAAIRAVWSAIGFAPDQELTDRMESLVLRRSELRVDDLEGELEQIARHCPRDR